MCPPVSYRLNRILCLPLCPLLRRHVIQHRIDVEPAHNLGQPVRRQPYWIASEFFAAASKSVLLKPLSRCATFTIRSMISARFVPMA